MQFRRLSVLALAAVGLVSVIGQAHAGNLNGGAIRGLFPGEFEAKVQGYRLYLAASKGGSLSGQAFGQKDRGRWFVQGNSLCVTFAKWTKGEAKCGTISQQGGWYVASSGGDEVLKFRRTALAEN